MISMTTARARLFMQRQNHVRGEKLGGRNEAKRAIQALSSGEGGWGGGGGGVGELEIYLKALEKGRQTRLAGCLH